MKFLKMMSIAVLLFAGVGAAVGYAATSNVRLQSEDLRIAYFLAPIGVGAALGLFIGLAASVMSLFVERSNDQ